MELNKAQRSALLIKLKEAEKEVRLTGNEASNLSYEETVRNFFEIDHYLAKERVRIITEALTENEIDY